MPDRVHLAIRCFDLFVACIESHHLIAITSAVQQLLYLTELLEALVCQQTILRLLEICHCIADASGFICCMCHIAYICVLFDC